MSRNGWARVVYVSIVGLLCGCDEECPDSIPALSESTVYTSYDAQAWDIQATVDGGFVIAGYAASDSNLSNANAILIKTSASGGVQWIGEFSGNPAAQGRSVQPTDDGGYVLAGSTGAFSLYEGVIHEPSDALVVKVDSAGSQEWSRNIDAGRITVANAVCANPNGNLLIAGTTQVEDGGEFDDLMPLLVMLDPNGNELWRRQFSQASPGIAQDVITTSDGGYAFTGGYGGEVDAPYVVKLNGDGDVEWEFSGEAGQSGFRTGQRIAELRSGGFAVIGSSVDDFFVARLDAGGELVWEKRVSGAPFANGYDLVETGDGNIVAGGYSYARNAFGARSCPHSFTASLSGEGALQWTKRLGSMDHDFAYAVTQGTNGSIALSTFDFSGNIYLVTTSAEPE